MNAPIVCAHHPERGALAYCNACGKPLCRDCVIRLPAGNYCEACAESPNGHAAKTRRAAPRPWLWAALLGAGLALRWLLRLVGS